MVPVYGTGLENWQILSISICTQVCLLYLPKILTESQGVQGEGYSVHSVLREQRCMELVCGA